jgi:hypothetical protein
LNCFEIGRGEGLFVAEKNTQEKSENEGGRDEARTSGHKLNITNGRTDRIMPMVTIYSLILAGSILHIWSILFDDFMSSF